VRILYSDGRRHRGQSRDKHRHRPEVRYAGPRLLSHTPAEGRVPVAAEDLKDKKLTFGAENTAREEDVDSKLDRVRHAADARVRCDARSETVVGNLT
jgi:hypothetical protein